MKEFYTVIYEWCDITGCEEDWYIFGNVLRSNQEVLSVLSQQVRAWKTVHDLLPMYVPRPAHVVWQCSILPHCTVWFRHCSSTWGRCWEWLSGTRGLACWVSLNRKYKVRGDHSCIVIAVKMYSDYAHSLPQFVGYICPKKSRAAIVSAIPCPSFHPNQAVHVSSHCSVIDESLRSMKVFFTWLYVGMYIYIYVLHTSCPIGTYGG